MHRMLMADWFTRLAHEAGLDFTGRGSSNLAFTIGSHDAFHVIAKFIDHPPFLDFVSSDPTRQSVVDQLVPEAVQRVKNFDFGGKAWYSTDFHELEFTFFPFSFMMGPLLQRLGGQRRILGWRKLGAGILLHFTEEAAAPEKQGHLLVPKAVVHVHIGAPGPCEGQFSSFVAEGVIETVVAICTFALGRPVQLPSTPFPSKDETLPILEERLADSSIGSLARNNVPLDIYNLLAIDGGLEIFRRLEAALITYDAAIRQERDSVAAILYVATGECLTTPSTSWRLRRPSKRFVDFFDELMPNDVDRIVSHNNFEQAFGIHRGTRKASALRREALKRMYSYRSLPLHEGLRPSYHGLGAGFDLGKHARRALLADFAETAIIRYLAAPRSSLIGDPSFEPDGKSVG